ncbi:MAG: hypothetical protein ABGY24_09695, partial [bacterium]
HLVDPAWTANRTAVSASTAGVNVDETIRRTGNLERDGAQSGRVSEGVGSIAASDELNTCP